MKVTSTLQACLSLAVNSSSNLFWPRSCVICKTPCCEDDTSITYCDSLCQHCAPNIHALWRHPGAESKRCSCCGELGVLTSSNNNHCLFCQIDPLGVRRLASLWPYEGKQEEIILSYKYQGKRGLSSFLAESLSRAIRLWEPYPERQWDLILPLPSSKQSLQKRGFNHLGSVVRHAAKLLALPSRLTTLRVSSKPQAQVEVPFESRRANVQDCFSARTEVIEGKNILLIDDVVTTGASIREAAKALYLAGASNVDVFAFTRSPRFLAHRLLSLQYADNMRP